LRVFASSFQVTLGCADLFLSMCALTRFAAGEGFEVAGEFVEVQSDKGSDALDRRPGLVDALASPHFSPRRAIFRTRE
jgi:hypothetical protein